MATISSTSEPGGPAAAHHPIRWPEGLLYALLAVSLDLAFSVPHLHQLRAGQLINPDSYMRLDRLRETMAAGMPVDVIRRGASGAGFVLHWSHLLDSLLFVLAEPFQLVLGRDHGLFAAALLSGPLEMAAIGLAVAWAAAPFASRTVLWMAPVLAALAPTITGYALPGVVHHHVLAVVTTVMVGGWVARVIASAGDGLDEAAGARAGWAIGAWTGVGVWLTPETMPLSAAGFGALYLAWLTCPATRGLAATLRAAGIAFLVTTAAALAIDPPHGGYGAMEIDRVSVAFLGVAIVAAAAGVAIAGIDRRVRGRGPRLLTSGAVGLLATGIWLAVFYNALFGPQALLDTAAVRVMDAGINEMQPVTTIGAALQYLFTGGAAAVILVGLTIARRSARLGYAAICAVALVIIAQQHVRFASYPATLGAVMLPIALTLLDRRSLAWPELAKSAIRVAAILLFVLLPPAGDLPLIMNPARASEPPQHSCSVTHLAGMLAPYAGQVVLTDPGDVPELLYRTRIDTVGSLYLRNAAGFMRLRAAWRSGPSADVPRAISRARIRYVLFCKRQKRSMLVEGLPRDTLLDRLGRGVVPPWLKEVASDPASGNILYKVVRQRPPRQAASKAAYDRTPSNIARK